jgi:hypothetical protein
VSEGVEDRLQVLVDAVGELDERLKGRGLRPLQPGLPEVSAASKGSSKTSPEVRWR